MRKLIKWVLILAVLFLALLGSVAAYISIQYPPEKLKTIAVSKLGESLHRKVSLGDVHFNILAGFKLSDLKIANRPGWAEGNMVVAKNITISYHLYELVMGYFSNKVILGEIQLDQPQILIERRGLDSFNFSDITGAAASAAQAPAPVPEPVKPAPAKQAPAKKPQKKHGKRASLALPVEEASAPSWFADNAWAATAPAPKSPMVVSIHGISINHGKVTYKDWTSNPPQQSDLKDLNLTVKNISTIGAKTTFDLDTPFVYSGLNYQLAMGGSFRYFQSGPSLKEMDVKGTVNGLGFNFSGDLLDMAGNPAPDMKGDASLNMLKFSGLVPKKLSSMPDGLDLTGPAKVDFHLGGKIKSGLELEGTADASELAVKYKDMFAKTAKSPCKVDFKSLISPDNSYYNLKSFKLTYENWEVNGSFNYRAGASYSGEVHSASLPFKGLPAMVPKYKDCKVDGSGSLDLAFSQALGNASSLNMKGRVDLKGVGVTLPGGQNYMQDITGPILLEGALIRVPSLAFKAFDGTGAAGVTYNLNSQAANYAFNLKNVDARLAINADIDAYVVKDPASYKDKLYGRLSMVYSGAMRGLTTAQMEASAVGNGTYTITAAKVKGYSAIKTVNGIFGDSSDELGFDKIDGTLSLKNQVMSYTATGNSKVGGTRVIGGINFEGVYTPNMKVLADVHKQFLDSDMVKSKLPPGTDIACVADANGDVPVDFTFTGPAKENHFSYNWDRLMKNVGDCLKKKAGEAIQQKAGELGQDLGNKLKGLFGK